MHALRRATFLARLVLAWFALATGLAMAAPLLQPADLQLVCVGGGGVKLVVAGEADEGQAAASFTLDCPLCASVAPPPARVQPAVLRAQAPAPAVLPPLPGVVRTAAPLPARGPPASS